jgi:hypothetical protein
MGDGKNMENCCIKILLEFLSLRTQGEAMAVEFVYINTACKILPIK